jgi:hypothetical protein
MGIIVKPLIERADEEWSRRPKTQSRSSATIDMRALAPSRLWLLLMIVAFGAGGCGTVATNSGSSTPLDPIRRAVEIASDSGSFRVRGEIGASVPIVQWDGIVVGPDEQYTMQASGLLLESRRIGGRNWGRRLDPTGPWVEAPYDGPVDLSVLLRGRPGYVDHSNHSSSITLQFASVDVLRALTHVPSVGPTTAHVTLVDGVLTEVTLELGGGVRAHVALTDFGAPMSIEPVEELTLAPRA